MTTRMLHGWRWSTGSSREESLAPPVDAIGRYYKMRDGTRVQVVGIVEDGKYANLTENPQPAMFLPVLQSPTSDMSLVVRSTRDPQQLARSHEEQTARAGSGTSLPEYNLGTTRWEFRCSLREWRWCRSEFWV